MSIRGKGISYSTGSFTLEERGREPFDARVVEREMRIIRDDLHCTAVRVIGADPVRLEIAAGYALEAGLEVWWCPFPIDMNAEQMLSLFADCALRAEGQRRSKSGIVFVTGAELTILAREFLPGDTLEERLALLSDKSRLREVLPQVPPRLDEFLRRAVAVVRERFGGKVSYASLPSERIDWSPFDFIGVDAYNSIEVADQYRDSIHELVGRGKPVAITEFGCVTIHGAAELGARGIFIVNRDRDTVAGLKDSYSRDEEEQAEYARELLTLFDEAGVDSAFWTVFSDRTLPYRSNPHEDLDMASYGVVKVLEDGFGETYPDMRWEPKAVFRAIAECYRP